MYALFPPTQPDLPAKEEMVRQTVQRLKQLDEERPEVILVPEPENPSDPRAVRVYCEGCHMGYVAHEQLTEAHRLFDASTPMVTARIVRVEAENGRNFFIEADVPTSALLKHAEKPEAVDAWKDWQCSIARLPMPDVWKNCQVLEYQIEKQFPVTTLEQVKNLKNYLKLWIDRSLHDFSVEAMQLRKRYIGRLRGIASGALENEAKRLEKQYAAICSGQRTTYRMQWWQQVQHSKSMERYWDEWHSSHKEDNLWLDLYKVDTQLRRMPGNLYALIGDLSSLFSTLRYRDDVTRSVLCDIYTLLQLRQRICRELGIAMKPLPLDAYGVKDDAEDVVPQLTDARLAKAVEVCQAYFWAKSAWAVVFCVCRDYFGMADNVSAFEKRVQSLPFSRSVETCPAGTVQKAIGNNDFMKKHIDKWEDGRALTLARELKSFLNRSF